MIVQVYEGQDDESTKVQWPHIGGSTSMFNLMSEMPVDPDGKPRKSGEDSPTQDMEILGATGFDHL